MINESRDWVGLIPSAWITKVTATELNNKNVYVIQIGAGSCYKLGQLCLLQIRVNVVTNWDSYHKLG